VKVLMGTTNKILIPESWNIIKTAIFLGYVDNMRCYEIHLCQIPYFSSLCPLQVAVFLEFKNREMKKQKADYF
jgi:hypothetical protein